jgi:hypothetical protein
MLSVTDSKQARHLLGAKAPVRSRRIRRFADAHAFGETSPPGGTCRFTSSIEAAASEAQPTI